MNPESINVRYLITCSSCLEQYVGSAFKLKARFRIHKFDIQTKKERYGSARHFNLLSANAAIWSNTLKQFKHTLNSQVIQTHSSKSRQIIGVCLIILWGWHLNG